MNAKDYKAELKWFNSSQAKQRAAAAKAQAISEFKKRFPAAKLCSVVRNNRLWNFSRYTVSLRLYSRP